ncbi:MAG: hypothetical protein QOI95_2676 [Acidimicrobiaceae bacterium]|jgi:hypothetical protein
MDPKVVLVLTWILAALVVAAYIWFVVWRYRVEQRKKAADDVTDTAMSDAIARTAQRMAPPPTSSPTAVGSAVVAPTPPPPFAASPEATVAGVLAGIALPHDLVPLTTIAPRPAVGDRVAFWTDRAPAEIVGPAFAAELERLGYKVIALDERTLSAQRESDRVLVMIHPEGNQATIGDQLAFSSVPEGAVVIEVWLPV